MTLHALHVKIYKKIRFQTWYRKAYYYHSRRKQMNGIIRKYGDETILEHPWKAFLLKRDMIHCLFKYGSYYSEYFLYGYPGKDADHRSSFVTEGIRMSYYPRMNLDKNTDMLENKYRTYKKFEEMYRREVIRIRKGEEPNEENLKKLEEFAARHGKYVVKPVYASFGTGVRVESLEQYASLEEAHQRYSKNGVVIEEVIRQGEAMACIHRDSVNTLRLPTVVIENEQGEKEVKLFHPSLRMGCGTSFVDNFSAGGVSALIDPETGKIYTDGADKKGNHYQAHPDSGIVFQGFQIPEWEDAAAMVKKAALMVPGNHYCGWDLAYSDRGWCMVEANCHGQMGAMQMVTQTGRRRELEALIRLMPKTAGRK